MKFEPEVWPVRIFSRTGRSAVRSVKLLLGQNLDELDGFRQDVTSLDPARADNEVCILGRAYTPAPSNLSGEDLLGGDVIERWCKPVQQSCSDQTGRGPKGVWWPRAAGDPSGVVKRGTSTTGAD